MWLSHPAGIVVPLLLGAGCWTFLVMATAWLVPYQAVLLVIGFVAVVPAVAWLTCGPDRLTLENDLLIRTRPFRCPQVMPITDISRIETGYRFHVGPRTRVVGGAASRMHVELDPRTPQQQALLLELGRRIEAKGMARSIQDEKTYDVLGLTRLNPRRPWSAPASSGESSD